MKLRPSLPDEALGKKGGSWWRLSGDRGGVWHYCALGVAKSACGRFERKDFHLNALVSFGDKRTIPPENACGHCRARLSMAILDPAAAREEAMKPQLAWPDELAATRGSGRRRRRGM